MHGLENPMFSRHQRGSLLEDLPLSVGAGRTHYLSVGLRVSSGYKPDAGTLTHPELD